MSQKRLFVSLAQIKNYYVLVKSGVRTGRSKAEVDLGHQAHSVTKGGKVEDRTEFYELPVQQVVR